LLASTVTTAYMLIHSAAGEIDDLFALAHFYYTSQHSECIV